MSTVSQADFVLFIIENLLTLSVYWCIFKVILIFMSDGFAAGLLTLLDM
jgi:hypothetical protein